MSDHRLRLLVVFATLMAALGAAVFLYVEHVEAGAAFTAGQVSILVLALLDAAGLAARFPRPRSNGNGAPPPLP